MNQLKLALTSFESEESDPNLTFFFTRNEDVILIENNYSRFSINHISYEYDIDSEEMHCSHPEDSYSADIEQQLKAIAKELNNESSFEGETYFVAQNVI